MTIIINVHDGLSFPTLQGQGISGVNGHLFKRSIYCAAHFAERLSLISLHPAVGPGKTQLNLFRHQISENNLLQITTAQALRSANNGVIHKETGNF